MVLDRDGRTPDTFAARWHCGHAASRQRRDLPCLLNTIVPLVQEPLSAVLGELHRRGIASVLVEGGATLLNTFLSAGPWDEARVFTAPVHFAHGTPAPRMERDAVCPVPWGGPAGPVRERPIDTGRASRAMALVAGTALLMAAIFLLFKAFAVRRIPLLPAIAVNYLVACAAGLLVAPPWSLPELPRLWWPAAGLGVVFIGMFFLTALSAERAAWRPRRWPAR